MLRPYPRRSARAIGVDGAWAPGDSLSVLLLPFLIAAFADDPPTPPPPPPEEDDDDGAEVYEVPYAVPYVPPVVVEPPKYQAPIPRQDSTNPPVAPVAASATTRYTPLLADAVVQHETRTGLVAVGLEGGYELLFGTNMAAWSPGPAARLSVDFQDAGAFRVGVSWGVGLHSLEDPTAVWGDAGADATARSQFHTLLGGGRYYLANTEKPAGFRVVPFVGGGGGMMLTLSQVQVLGLSSSTTRLRVVVEGSGGAELRIGKAALVVGARVALVPILQKRDSGQLSPGGILPLSPILGAIWTL